MEAILAPDGWEYLEEIGFVCENPDCPHEPEMVEADWENVDGKGPWKYACDDCLGMVEHAQTLVRAVWLG